jgi:hypothetical protein
MKPAASVTSGCTSTLLTLKFYLRNIAFPKKGPGADQNREFSQAHSMARVILITTPLLELLDEPIPN